MSNFALSDDAVVLGFDPGGERSFGAAVLFRSEFAATTVGCVRDALTWAIERCGDQVPMAAGLDALLHWSDEPSGWRFADRALRTAYPRLRSSIISPNGLFGSMAFGGIALAFRLRERWPNLVLNETRPKVLHSASIDPTKVREEIYAVIRPGKIASYDGSGRYQSVKFAVWPKRQRVRHRLFDQSTFSPRHAIEPRPVLF